MAASGAAAAMMMKTILGVVRVRVNRPLSCTAPVVVAATVRSLLGEAGLGRCSVQAEDLDGFLQPHVDEPGLRHLVGPPLRRLVTLLRGGVEQPPAGPDL